MIETITVRPPPTRPAPAAPAMGRSQAALPKIAPAPLTTSVETTPAKTAPVETAPAEKTGFSLWGDDGFGFDDFLDAINPLQHIPILGTLYREIVGDDIGIASRLVGGALFAGIPGLIGSAVDAAFEAVSGKDLGTTALALVGLGRDDRADGKVATALAATQFENPLALRTQADDHVPAAQALKAQAAAMAAQNFALRFDYETSAYRHGQRLLSQHRPAFETSA